MRKLIDYKDEECEYINWSKCTFKGYKMNIDERARFCSLMVKKWSDCNIVLTKTKICFVAESFLGDDNYVVLSYAEYDKKSKLMKFHNYPETEESEPEWIFADYVAETLGLDHIVFEKKVYWGEE